MPTNTNDESTDVVEFNLKHRITGAAVLLFLGAAVLPWLLGPPTQANKVEPSIALTQTSESEAGIEEADLLLDGTIDVEETVYVSKITPMDANKKGTLQKAAQKAATEPVKVSPETVISGASQKDEEAVKDAKAKELALAKKREAEQLNKDKRRKEQAQATAKAKADKERKEQQQKNDAAALQAKLAKEKVNKVDVGWIVQVGLFTEKDRAIAFISQLKNKGFNASSNVVDTNRGVNTGTRVWLGPFARKSSAANEVKRLKSKAGKDGFIRVYP